MNYGGDAADQIVRYSMEGMEHTLRISGSIAKNLAVFIVAVLKDQKKTYGKTQMVRMIKERRPTKFFTVPDDRMKEFAREAKARGLLYVVIKDKKKPINNEIMVFAEDAAKMNRVLDRMDIDYVKAESGKVEFDTGDPKREETKDIDLGGTSKQGQEKKVQTVSMPEGTIEFEIDESDQKFDFGDMFFEEGNFTQGKEEKLPSGTSSPSRDFSSGQKNREHGVGTEESAETKQTASKDERAKIQEKGKREVMLYGFNRDDSESCGGSELGAKVIERRVCSFKETGAGRNVDADRWTGTVGVPGWSVLAEVSGFYGRAV